MGGAAGVCACVCVCGGVTFVTTLSRGKVTARPLENQRGGEHRSGGFLLFISVDMLLLVFFQANGEGER